MLVRVEVVIGLLARSITKSTSQAPSSGAGPAVITFQSFFERAGLGMLIVNLDETILLTNASLGAMLGYTNDELTQMKLSRILHRDDGHKFMESFNYLVSGKRERFVLDCRIKGNQGKRLWVHVYVDLFRDDDGAPMYVFATVEDITRSRQMQEELRNAKEAAEEATKVKSEFLANMSHEIRTPIHTIIRMGELMIDTNLDVEQAEYATQIQFSADVLLSLVNNILDFSKIEAGRLSLEIIEFDLPQVVEEAADLISLESHKKGLEAITWIHPTTPHFMKGDPHRIRQIIINLVKNAVKFTSEGEILVSVKPMGEIDNGLNVRFAIKDTGIGIPEDKRDRLFALFSQVDSSTTRKFGGTGLGLSISRDLTELMGGEIGADSQEGKGSTFWFNLPLQYADSREPTAKREERLASLRVLIVDDNKMSRSAVRSYLTAWGCVTSEASSGKKALEILREAADTPDALDMAIIDSQMPGIDGWQLASEISSDKAINSTKLILLTPTGKSGAEAKMKFLHWFDEYLNKPVSAHELRKNMNRIIVQDLGLPATEVEELQEAEEVRNAKKKHLTILIAEDHFVNQELFKSILQRWGHTIDVANDGREAVEAAKTKPFDLIFMDIQMPNMNGLEATQAIREMGVKTPIIAVSATAIKEEMDNAISIGMSAFIVKPFKQNDLLPVIEEWAPKEDAAPQQQDAASQQQDTAPGPDPQPDETDVPVADAAEAVDTEGAQVPVFDFEKAVETFMGQKDVVVRVVREFLPRVHDELKQLKVAYMAGDFDTVRNVAHKIKGGSLNLEIHRLGGHASELEKAGRDKQKGAAYTNLKALIEDYKELKEYVDSNILQSA